MGVKVNGEADFFLQGLDEFLRGVGTAEAGHILDGEKVGAHFFQFFREADVVFEGKLIAFLVEDVAGVAEGGFADTVGRVDGLHGDAEIG